MKLKIVVWLVTFLYALGADAAEKTLFKIGVLAFGTVEWELAALENENMLAGADFDLQVQKLANPEAGKIALQSGAVDMIVSDWIWTARMRTSGTDLSFYPYSSAAGALMVPANSPIKQLSDLAGKKLGIAGGELDKNWLLLQALAKQQGVDLSNVTKVFGAPPLLNQQLLQGQIDALINYWHFAARLEAQGYQMLYDGQSILQGLDIAKDMPNLGYVFNRNWAEAHQAALNHFFVATEKVRAKLCSDDSAWNKIVPLTKAEDQQTATILRQRYCAGQVKPWGTTEQQAAERIYSLLRQLSNNQLTGTAETLPPGLFWTLN